MTTPFPVQVIFLVTCARCRAVQEVCYNLGPGNEMPKPAIPPGWTLLNGSVYCTAHQVSVDGVVIE